MNMVTIGEQGTGTGVQVYWSPVVEEEQDQQPRPKRTREELEATREVEDVMGTPGEDVQGPGDGSPPLGLGVAHLPRAQPLVQDLERMEMEEKVFLLLSLSPSMDRSRDRSRNVIMLL